MKAIHICAYVQNQQIPRISIPHTLTPIETLLSINQNFYSMYVHLQKYVSFHAKLYTSMLYMLAIVIPVKRNMLTSWILTLLIGIITLLRLQIFMKSIITLWIPLPLLLSSNPHVLLFSHHILFLLLSLI